MFISLFFLLSTLNLTLCQNTIDDNVHNTIDDNVQNTIDDNVHNTPDDTIDDTIDDNFKNFYTCFQNCATTNSIDIAHISELLSEDKICTTLTSNKNAVNFIKCYTKSCTVDLDLTTLPFNTTHITNDDFKNDKPFNCPGFDPSTFDDSAKNFDIPAKSNSIHMTPTFIFLMSLFLL